MNTWLYIALERVCNLLSEPRQMIDCSRIIGRGRMLYGFKRCIFLPFGAELLCCPKCGELCQPRGKCELALVPTSDGIKLLIVYCKCLRNYHLPVLAEIREKAVDYDGIMAEKDPAVV